MSINTEQTPATKPLPPAIKLSNLLSDNTDVLDSKDILDNAFTVKQNNLTGIELFNSIYNLWGHYFTDAASFVSFKNKAADSFLDLQKKLFEDGFVKIFSAASVECRSMYFLNKDKKIIVYISIDKDYMVPDGDQLAVNINSFGDKSKGPYFYASLMTTISKDASVWLRGFHDFYATLPEVEIILKPKNSSAFYMIAQNSQGIHKKATVCNPKPIKDERYELFYGEHFPHNVFKKFVTEDTIGHLMLLYGHPGTGKSNYIKSLIAMCNRPVIYIPPSMAAVLSSPSFVEFIMDNKGSVLLIEDAEEVMSKDRNTATNNILNITDGFLKDALDLKIICTFNTDVKNIDVALRRKGRLHCEYEFRKLKRSESLKLVDFLDLQVSTDKIEDEMTLAELFNIDDEVKLSTGLDKRVIGFGV